MFKRKSNARSTTAKRFRRRRPYRKSTLSRVASRFLETKKKTSTLIEVVGGTLTNRLRYSDSAMTLTQDSSYSGLQGHWVNAVGIAYRWMFHNNATNTNLLRFLVLKVKQGAANLDYQTGASLFETDTGDVSLSTLTDASYAYRRVNKDKYTVLKDRLIRLSGTVGDRDKVQVVKGWIPMKLRKINYSSSNVRPNNDHIVFLFLSAEGDDDVGTNEEIEISGESTFYYKDA